MLKFENQTNGRFYYISIVKDMLNDCVIRIVYGGHRHRRISRERHIACDSQRDLLSEIQRLSLRRLSRGYSLVT